MGKNRDLIQILVLVIVGMFIPFLGSMIINFGLDFTNKVDLMKIVLAFGYFLIIFGIELGVVYLYFNLTNRYANKNIEKFKPKR